jgi:hypothetical protein
VIVESLATPLDPTGSSGMVYCTTWCTPFYLHHVVYTLLPAPHGVHPATCTTWCTPCYLHHVVYTLLPAPHGVQPATCTVQSTTCLYIERYVFSNKLVLSQLPVHMISGPEFHQKRHFLRDFHLALVKC